MYVFFFTRRITSYNVCYTKLLRGREYKRILLPLTKIKRIKVTNGIGALGAKLVVYAKANGFETKYPSVALSACSLSQIKAIKSAINQGVSKE